MVVIALSYFCVKKQVEDTELVKLNECAGCVF